MYVPEQDRFLAYVDALSLADAAHSDMEPSPSQQSEEDQVGWARKLKSGEWSGRYRDEHGDQKSTVKSYPRERDAIAAALIAERSIREGQWVDPTASKQTFGTYALEIMAARVRIAPSTRDRDDRYMRRHVLPTFGSAKLIDISRRDIQKWIGHLENKGLKSRTIKECRRLLSMVLAEAVEDELISKNPCHKVEIPRPDDSERRYLTEPEVEILAAALPPRFALSALLAVYAGGLRWGEIFGLQRRHVDLTEKTIRIEGTLQRVRGVTNFVTTPKTKAARRTVELDDWLVDMLAEHLDGHDHDFVFPSRNGGPTNYSHFRQRVWNPAVERAGLAPLTFHELRHTAAALMVRHGANQLELMRFLGHRDSSTTFNSYGHLYPGMIEATRGRMSAARSLAQSAARSAESAVNARVGRPGLDPKNVA